MNITSDQLAHENNEGNQSRKWMDRNFNVNFRKRFIIVFYISSIYGKHETKSLDILAMNLYNYNSYYFSALSLSQ